jgi:hypothetical protein
MPNPCPYCQSSRAIYTLESVFGPKRRVLKCKGCGRMELHENKDIMPVVSDIPKAH